jgi:hypothetical protein
MRSSKVEEIARFARVSEFANGVHVLRAVRVRRKLR